MKKENIPSEFKILCPYCSAPYSARMEEELSSSEGCDTCGYGGGTHGTIDIYCENCKKLVYRKEFGYR